jgi:hypothetical protein
MIGKGFIFSLKAFIIPITIKIKNPILIIPTIGKTRINKKGSNKKINTIKKAHMLYTMCRTHKPADCFR